jgi:hypothetical protein
MWYCWSDLEIRKLHRGGVEKGGGWIDKDGVGDTIDWSCDEGR